MERRNRPKNTPAVMPPTAGPESLVFSLGVLVTMATPDGAELVEFAEVEGCSGVPEPESVSDPVGGLPPTIGDIDSVLLSNGPDVVGPLKVGLDDSMDSEVTGGIEMEVSGAWVGLVDSVVLVGDVDTTGWESSTVYRA